MRAPSLTLAAAGLVLLAPTAPPGAVPQRVAAREVASQWPAAQGVRPAPGPAPGRQGPVAAAELLAKVRDCEPVSRGRYRTDAGAPPTVPVCGTRNAVFWKADLDVDCDGRPTARCNRRTDPLFSASTAFRQSDGRYLSAERLPYIVVPAVGRLWDHREHGVRGGSVAAVVYRDRVRYAVVGDVGPRDIIGEASYATAEALGIRPDPRGGGIASGVTYIVFRDSLVEPIEDHAAAVATGERLARLFARGEGESGSRPDGAAPAPADDGPDADAHPAVPDERHARTGTSGRPDARGTRVRMTEWAKTWQRRMEDGAARSAGGQDPSGDGTGTGGLAHPTADDSPR